jgi:hypothetical protein
MTEPPRPPVEGLTIELINAALIEPSRERGYCLCIHPMMGLINWYGLTCKWCGQPVPEQPITPENKAIRTAAIRALYPWAVVNPDGSEPNAGDSRPEN